VLAQIRFLTEPFAAPYMQRALVAVLVLAVLAGVVGVVVQLRRLTFMSDALTHTVFPGVAIAFFTGNSLFVGALVAGVASATLLTLPPAAAASTTTRSWRCCSPRSSPSAWRSSRATAATRPTSTSCCSAGC
jgi:ABC-type Mn2+/Zn2+ transport system permease subunit